MAKNLAALKVKIGLKNNGNAEYPDFNKLPSVKSVGMDWANYIDHPNYGRGWSYDRKYGHREAGPDSPEGMQWGVILVNDTFATEAVAMYPSVCSKITDAEMDTFYNDRVTAKDPVDLVDTTIIDSLQKELALKESISQDTTALKAKIAKALDPNDAEPGIVKNPIKTWTEKKAKEDIAIVKAVAEIG